jgi:hypothetical protein
MRFTGHFESEGLAPAVTPDPSICTSSRMGRRGNRYCCSAFATAHERHMQGHPRISNAPLRDEEYSADGPADPPLDPGVRFVRSVYGRLWVGDNDFPLSARQRLLPHVKG